MFEFDRYGTVEINDDRIVSFNEKKHCSEGLINGGLYIVERGFIETLDLPETFSFEKEVLEKIADSEALMGLVFNEVFIDIGIPEEYHRAGSVLNSWLNE
jgi:D-glycero-alpha-D-manno-heptose 1-phosphate guanylyltransferase